jgi:hypothetical protein
MPFVSRRRRLLRQLACGVAALGLGAAMRPAQAHRAHVSLTRVLANPRAGTWEIVHSVHTHDAITALAAWLPGEDPNPASDRARARIALEVERRVLWSAPDGKPLQPRMVGAELAGDDVVVYQELTAPSAEGEYAVACTLLQDIFADQQNVVQFAVIKPPVVARLSAALTRARFRYAR